MRRGTFTAAAVAVASSVPGISTLVASTAADAPAVDTGVSDATDDSGDLTEPLVAQVKDLNTGEISLFQGERRSSSIPPHSPEALASAVRP